MATPSEGPTLDELLRALPFSLDRRRSVGTFVGTERRGQTPTTRRESMLGLDSCGYPVHRP